MNIAAIGFPSSKTVSIRIYDVTAASEIVAWTSTGVVERANGNGESIYRYSFTEVAGHAYDIDWKDDSSPVNTAGDFLSEIDTLVPAQAGDQMDLVNAPNVTAVTAIQDGLSKLTQQQVRDAMKLAPSGGDPDENSIEGEILNVNDDVNFLADSFRQQLQQYFDLLGWFSGHVTGTPTASTFDIELDNQVGTVPDDLSGKSIIVRNPQTPGQTGAYRKIASFSFVSGITFTVTVDPAFDIIPAQGDGIIIGILPSASASVDVPSIVAGVEASSIIAKEATSQDILSAIAAVTPLSGSNKCTLTVYETATTTPIADAHITIMNSAETLVLGVVHTDSNGKTLNEDGNDEIMLDPNVNGYVLYLRKAGVVFAVTALTNAELLSGALTVYGSPLVIGAPASGSSCRVYEYCFGPDDTTPLSLSSVDARVEIVNLPYDSGGKIHSNIVPFVYDSGTGLIYWDIAKGATVRFFLRHFYDVPAEKVIPNSTTVRLQDIT